MNIKNILSIFKKKRKHNIVFVITELGRFRYYDFVHLLIKQYPNVNVHFILHPSLICAFNSYASNKEQYDAINNIIIKNYIRLFSTFASNVNYHPIITPAHEPFNVNTFYEQIHNKLVDILSSLDGETHVFAYSLGLINSVKTPELKQALNNKKHNVKFIFTSYHSFYLLNDSGLHWFKHYPNIQNYDYIILHAEHDKKYLIKDSYSTELIKEINNMTKVINIPVLRHDVYTHSPAVDSHVLIVLHWEKGFSKAEQYLDGLVNLVGNYPDEKFLFRLHPLFVREATNDKQPFLAKGIAKNFINTLNRFDNVIFSNDESIFEVFMGSKMMIIDGITMISDYFLTQKPLILLNSVENPVKKHFNEFFLTIKDGLYDVKNGDELNQVFDNIILHNKDSKKETRKEICKRLFPNEIDPKYFNLLGIKLKK